MFNELKHIPEAWREALRTKGFAAQFVLSLLLLAACASYNFHYLRIWQERPGVQVNDIILNLLPPRDFSVAIFMVEYITMVLIIVFTVPYPDRLVKGFQMFALLIVLRTISIYFFALEPPRDMVNLNDPFADFFLHSKTVFVSKDLFFSGHIGALALLMLICVNRYLKFWALLATIIVGVLIIWQHVHYSLDVAFAPFVSYVCFKFVNLVHRETRYGLELHRG